MLNQKVISNVLELLEMMDEGLTYVKQKIMELNVEASVTVLLDTIDAFYAIEETIYPMQEQLDENKIVEKTNELRERLDILVKEYEKENGHRFYEIMQLSLEPAFKKWKEEIEVILRPYVAS